VNVAATLDRTADRAGSVISAGMPRSEGQSDFSVERPAEVALPASAQPVGLPDARAIAAQAGALSSRWVMRATWLMLFALAVLCLVGPHIPAGE